MNKIWKVQDENTKRRERKMTRFETKADAEHAIATVPQFAGCSAIWVSSNYAASHGVSLAGWYLYSKNGLHWAVS
jgi:hypothetical protein